ncbi:MAG: murein biosynthesis integral membrane protein MurJ [Eubacterium sp.]|nr:murein biosynthesis integral membrane protein MurJ [Eubacterium sp.]
MSGKRNQTQTGVMKAAGILVIANLLSSILGYARDIILLSVFDVSPATDAYNAAFVIPDLIYTILVGGGLSAAFIPVFSGYIAEKKYDDGFKMASTVLNIVAIVAAVICVIGEIFAPQILPFVIRGMVTWEPETIQLTVTLTRIMFFQCFFMCLTGICMGILQSYKDFTPPSIGAVLYNITIIGVGVLLLTLGTGIAGFSIGVVTGSIVNLLVQIFPIQKHGFKYRRVVDLDHEGVKQFFKLFAPVLIGISVTQLNLVVNKSFASAQGKGILTSITQAQRLMQLPINIFALAIAMSIFPTMVEHFTTDNMDEYKKDLSLGVRNVSFIILPCAVGMIAVRVPLVRAIYLQGNFSPENVPVVATLLALYCIGMIGYSVRQVILQGFYAVKETRVPVRINIFILCLNMLLTVLFVRIWSANGIAFAYSVAGLASMFIQTYYLRKKIGSIRGHEIKDSIIKCLICCAVMFVVTTASMIIFEHYISVELKRNMLLELIVLAAIGAGTYVVMALALKMQELTSILAVIKRRLRG